MQFHHLAATLAFAIPALASPLASSLDSQLTRRDGAWDCYVFDGGPSNEQRKATVDLYDGYYGLDPIQYQPGEGTIIICNGVTFGLINNGGVTATEIGGDRHAARDANSDNGQACFYYNRDNRNLGWLWGNEDDFARDGRWQYKGCGGESI